VAYYMCVWHCAPALMPDNFGSGLHPQTKLYLCQEINPQSTGCDMFQSIFLDLIPTQQINSVCISKFEVSASTVSDHSIHLGRIADAGREKSCSTVHTLLKVYLTWRPCSNTWSPRVDIMLLNA
jgi:hypothetical protein